MARQPLLLPYFCYILGIFFQEYFRAGRAILLVLLAVTGIILVTVLFFSRVKSFSAYLALPFFFLLAALLHSYHSGKPEIPTFQTKETTVFTIQQKLNSTEKNRRYQVAVLSTENSYDRTFFPVQAVLSLPKTERPLDFGHYYKAELYIRPADTAVNDYSFDYAKYLARRDVFLQAYVSNGYLQANRNQLTFAERIKAARLTVLSKLDSVQLAPKTREFTKGIILADRSEMDAVTVQDFSRSGLVHLLAISGSHMAIIFWLLLAVLEPLFPVRFRNAPLVTALVAIWVFAVFIDYGSSVVRSCLMLTVYYIYVFLQRKPDLLHAMALSALLILLADTRQIFEVGFQLSYVAVFGIFWLNGPLLSRLPKPKNKLQNFLLNIVTVSIAAQVATLPLVLYYFHQYSLLSVIANLVIIPFSEVIIIFALLMVVLTAFSLEFSLLNFLYDRAVNLLLEAVHLFGSGDRFFSKNIPVNLLEVLLLFATVYFLRFVVLDFRRKHVVNFATVVLLFIGVRLVFNFYHFKKEEGLVHHHFKQRYFSVKTGDRVYFWVDEETDREKLQKYIIDPYLTSRRADSAIINTIPSGATAVSWKNKQYNLR